MNQQVQPATTLRGTIQLPADKSISHRSAMFAALHEGTSTIKNFSTAADPHSTLACLRRLGVEINEKDTTIIVKGVGRDGFETPTRALNCGNSGTTMRLLSGIVGGAGVSAQLTGDDSLSARTMKRIITPLQKMGITIDARDDDFAPLEISRSGPVQPLHFPLPMPSAQLKSCILLAGLFGDAKTEVIETTVSRDHTERLLQLPIEQQGAKKVITSSRSHPIPAQNYRIPGDFSAAAFWLVAGSIFENAQITLPATGINPTRTGARNILKSMGASIDQEDQNGQGLEPTATISVTGAPLKPIDITPELVPNCIDELPILMVAMLFADGPSTVRGAEDLRHKETDRLSAMAAVLEKAGASFEEHADGFTIYGSPDFEPSVTTFASEHDHRIAMAAAVLAAKASGPSSIKNADCTAISYPTFWRDLQKLTD